MKGLVLLQAKIRTILVNKCVLFNPEVVKFIECHEDLLEERNVKDTTVFKKAYPLWAQAILKKYTGKKHMLTNQWTSLLGELIVEKLVERHFNEKCERIKDKNMCVDFTTPKRYIEVKTRNFFTTGTAGEKILGTPYKYANLKDLGTKPLHIVVLGFQEYEAEHYFHLFSPSGNQIKILDFYKSLGIEYTKASSLLKIKK